MRNKTPFLSINFGFLLILIALQSVKKKNICSNAFFLSFFNLNQFK